jgi:hypothetical protein
MAVNTHIFSAMKRKDVERVSMLLLTPGYDVNTVSKAGTPLLYATKMGKARIWKMVKKSYF